MRYALNIAEGGRILSATYEKYAPDGVVLVENLPKGNLPDYLYVDGEYVYSPLPKVETAHEPTANEILNALLGVSE
jgi:hypothetical protein